MEKCEIAHLSNFTFFHNVFLFFFFNVLKRVYMEERVKKEFILNSLPNDKNLECSKFKALADDKINVSQKLKFGFGRVENIVGKGRKCWLPCFQKPSFSESLQVGIVWQRVNYLNKVTGSKHKTELLNHKNMNNKRVIGPRALT